MWNICEYLRALYFGGGLRFQLRADPLQIFLSAGLFSRKRVCKSDLTANGCNCAVPSSFNLGFLPAVSDMDILKRHPTLEHCIRFLPDITQAKVGVRVRACVKFVFRQSRGLWAVQAN